MFLPGMDSVGSGGQARKETGARRYRRAGGPASRGTGRGRRDEAVAFIAEQAGALCKLAARHKLGVLHHLLGMTKLEADERLRLRSKRKLS